MEVSGTSEYSSLDDKELVSQYKTTDDVQILGILFERYVHLIYGVSLKYLKNREESQDAAMAIFEKLVVDLKKHEVLNFKSWLHVMTKNYCLMKLRSSKYRQQSNAAELNNETNMEISLPVHHKEEDLESDLQILEECIDELKGEQQTSVKLFFLEQKCYREIEEMTGFELKKVKSFIQNGKRNLKLCIEKHREST